MTYYLSHIENLQFQKLTRAELEKHLPSLPELDAKSIQSYVTKCREKLYHLMDQNISAIDLHQLYSTMLDQVVSALFAKNLDTKNLCLIAVGGYGREELSFFSDIDLILLQKGNEKLDANEFLYPLWDAKLDVSFSTRSLEKTQSEILSEQTALTSLMNSRYLCGEKKLYLDLQQEINQAFENKKFKKYYLKEKKQELKTRLDKYGGSLYILKPNIKESAGALRELHLIRWIAQCMKIPGDFSGLFQEGFISAEEYKALDFALEFLLRIRNSLHRSKGKKSDQMQFEDQVNIASALGYKTEPEGSLAVEKFMGDFYTIALQNRKILDKALFYAEKKVLGPIQKFTQNFQTKKLDADFILKDDLITLKDPECFEKRPLTLMTAFYHIQQTGRDLHFETKELITGSLYLVDKNFRENYEVTNLFRKIMTQPYHLDRVLFNMHETHFFDSFIPEFLHLRNQVQHDVYHVYTVDIHSFFAIRELCLLFQEKYKDTYPTLHKVAGDVSKFDILSLAILFHDIGKGLGGNHSQKGAKLANQITRRLGYNTNDQENIEFLVLSHLSMSQIAQRRDLDDEHLIYEFAKSVKKISLLNKLYILTWADIRTTHPEAWTDWKSTLLQDLYFKTHDHLSQENTQSGFTHEKIQTLRKKVFNQLMNQTEPEKLQLFLEKISPRYLRANTDEEILSDLRYYYSRTKKTASVYEISQGAESTRLLLFLKNQDGVLTSITGVMASFHINILAIDISRIDESEFLIKMHVQNNESRDLSAIEERLNDVLEGQTDIDVFLENMPRKLNTDPRPVGRAESQIKIDNDVSPYYTVIDIISHDRLGLLHKIIRCLTELNCLVEVSKISTLVEQVVDTFYVKNSDGEKITNKSVLREIKERLLVVLSDSAAEDQKKEKQWLSS